MKRIGSLCMLTLAVIACACTSVMAGDGENEEIFYYGDYAYTLMGGLATIVGYSGGQCGTELDDEGGNELDRPGMADASAQLLGSFDADGAWRIAIPATLDGHPVTAIGDHGLAGAVRVGNITLPEGLTSIEDNAFIACGLMVIDIPASVTFIGGDAFKKRGPTLRVTGGSYAARYAEDNGIPCTYEPDYAVYESGAWMYTLDGGMATIRGYERYDGEFDSYGNAVSAPVELVFPDELGGYPVAPVTSLPLRYFTVNTLTSVTIPASVTEISGAPFLDYWSAFNRKIIGFTVDSGNPAYADIDGVLFDRQLRTLVAWPGGREGTYVIPDGVTAIGDRAFWGCDGLSGVTIPASVEHIGEGVFHRAWWAEPVTLFVTKGSYAEQYAKENGLRYVHDVE